MNPTTKLVVISGTLLIIIGILVSVVLTASILVRIMAVLLLVMIVHLFTKWTIKHYPNSQWGRRFSQLLWLKSDVVESRAAQRTSVRDTVAAVTDTRTARGKARAFDQLRPPDDTMRLTMSDDTIVTLRVIGWALAKQLYQRDQRIKASPWYTMPQGDELTFQFLTGRRQAVVFEFPGGVVVCDQIYEVGDAELEAWRPTLKAFGQNQSQRNVTITFQPPEGSAVTANVFDIGRYGFVDTMGEVRVKEGTDPGRGAWADGDMYMVCLAAVRGGKGARHSPGDQFVAGFFPRDGSGGLVLIGRIADEATLIEVRTEG